MEGTRERDQFNRNKGQNRRGGTRDKINKKELGKGINSTGTRDKTEGEEQRIKQTRRN